MKNGKNHKGGNGKLTDSMLKKWFDNTERILWELEESNMDNKKRINLAEKRIEQNEKALAEQKNFNKIVAQHLGVKHLS